ncbi:MAG: hypothetical protein AAGG02_05720 [Cyanobacteria bacterium P01_H01_bin.15]
MQDKQKVTLYIPPSLHRQLKIRAAVEDESMSALVERAIEFFLHHPEQVESVSESRHGRTHQIHICPECDSAMVLRDGKMVSLRSQPSVVTDPFPSDVAAATSASDSPEEERLVPC